MSSRAARIVSCALLAPFLLALVYGYASGGALQLITGGDIRSASPRAVPDALLAPGDASTVVRLAALGGVVAVLALVFAAGQAASKSRRPALFGRASLGGIREARRAGLISNDGPVLGKIGRHYLRLPGSLSAMLLAAPGQAKTAAAVVPTACLHSGSLFVTDIKPELHEMTSAYRARFQRVYRFAPFDPDGRTHRFNPLGELPPEPADRIDRIMFVAAMWYPANGSPIWYESARALFLGLALYLDESPGVTLSFPELYRHGTGMGRSLRDYVRLILKTRGAGAAHADVLDGPPLSEACRFALGQLAATESANVSTSIERTFLAPLAPWANPRLAAATATSDFSMADMVASPRGPQTVYFAMKALDIERAAPFVELMFVLLVDASTRSEAGRALAPSERCVALLDEAGQLGYIRALERLPAIGRDYGLSVFLIAQSRGQFRAPPPRGYGHDGADSLFDSIPTRVAYTPANLDEAREYSDAIGTSTTHSTSRRRAGLGKRHAPGERTESETGRAVMLPQEVQRLPAHKALLRTEVGDILMIERVPWFHDAEIVRRLCSASPMLAASCRLTRFGWVRRWPTKAAVYAARAELSAPVPRLVIEEPEAWPTVPEAVQETVDAPHDAEVDIAAVMERTADMAPLGDEATDDEIAAMGAALWAAIDDTGD